MKFIIHFPLLTVYPKGVCLPQQNHLECIFYYLRLWRSCTLSFFSFRWMCILEKKKKKDTRLAVGLCARRHSLDMRQSGRVPGSEVEQHVCNYTVYGPTSLVHLHTNILRQYEPACFLDVLMLSAVRWIYYRHSEVRWWFFSLIKRVDDW